MSTINPMKRLPSETQKEYKERLRSLKQAEKAREPKILWNSRFQGTYVRAKHGELGS